MKCIDEVIKKMQAKALGDDGDYMIMLLALADKLCEISKEANAVLYLDKIAQTFCEVLEKQQDIIVGLKAGTNSVNSGAGVQSNDLPGLQTAVGEEKKTGFYLEVPQDGEFKDSTQVKKAFIAYLKTPSEIGKELSETTVYDYSSRINMLFVYFEREWQAGKLDGKFQVGEAKFIDGKTYLNVYNHLELLTAFVRAKEEEIRRRAQAEKPFSSEELAESPLNTYKNLRNSIAALAKFEKFKARVAEIVKSRGEM